MIPSVHLRASGMIFSPMMILKTLSSTITLTSHGLNLVTTILLPTVELLATHCSAKSSEILSMRPGLASGHSQQMFAPGGLEASMRVTTSITSSHASGSIAHTVTSPRSSQLISIEPYHSWDHMDLPIAPSSGMASAQETQPSSQKTRSKSLLTACSRCSTRLFRDSSCGLSAMNSRTNGTTLPPTTSDG